MLPEAYVVAAINGADIVVERDEDVDHVYTSSGFNNAVLGGLTKAAVLGERVARIDTNEHNLHVLPAAFSLLDDADVVVLDLVFDRTTLQPGSAEEYHTKFVIPSIISFATRHSWSLGGSHGFMALRASALQQVLPIITSVLSLANATESAAHRPHLTWSADTLLPIVAHRLGLRVEIVLQPATTKRNNSAAKCARQTWDLLCLLDSLEKVLPA